MRLANLPVRQRGFTLIELMVALILGLLLVAAATQLFISGQNAYRVQTGAANVQDNGVFGMSFITRNIRLANAGALSNLTDVTPLAGIIITGLPASGSNVGSGNLLNVRFGSGSGGRAPLQTDLTAQNVSDANVQAGSTVLKNDRLVIAYQAQQDMRNCEGTLVTAGQFVLERIYVGSYQEGSLNRQGLFCDASSGFEASADPRSTAVVEVAGFQDTGVMMMQNVDAFKFSLILNVRSASGGSIGSSGTRELSLSAYRGLPAAQRQLSPIVGVKLAVLVRSDQAVGASDGANTYDLLNAGDTVTAPDDGFIRQVYVTTVALRNAFPDKEV